MRIIDWWRRRRAIAALRTELARHNQMAYDLDAAFERGFIDRREYLPAIAVMHIRSERTRAALSALTSPRDHVGMTADERAGLVARTRQSRGELG